MPPGPLIVLITVTVAGGEIFLMRMRLCCLCLHEAMTYENADVRTNKKIITIPNLKQRTFMSLLIQLLMYFCGKKTYILLKICSVHSYFFVLPSLSKMVNVYIKFYILQSFIHCNCSDTSLGWIVTCSSTVHTPLKEGYMSGLYWLLTLTTQQQILKLP
jgi:hypothetical protein